MMFETVPTFLCLSLQFSHLKFSIAKDGRAFLI